MSTDEVVFKANGEWSFGQPISEMDVKAEIGRASCRERV